MLVIIIIIIIIISAKVSLRHFDSSFAMQVGWTMLLLNVASNVNILLNWTECDQNWVKFLTHLLVTNSPTFGNVKDPRFGYVFTKLINNLYR